MRWPIVAALLVCSSAASAQNLVRVTQGSGRGLEETRLYVVDYNCGYDSSVLQSFTSSLYGFGIYTDIVTNFGAELKSRNAAANPATAESAAVFNTNVVTYRIRLAGPEQPKPGACPGQFFISGAENYSLIGKAGYTETNTFGDFAARMATLIITGASAIYPLVRLTKPIEFDNRVNETRDVLKTFSDFQTLFKVSRADSIDLPKDLQIGRNSVTAYDSSGRRAAWLTLNVSPVVSLVKSHNTKFLRAYQAAAASTAITITGTDDELRQRCSQAKQLYLSSGIRDNFDIAYLLYQRLLVAAAPPEKTVKCMGDRVIVLAALDLLNQKKSPIVAAKELRISRQDVDNFLPVLGNSDQPHTRIKLASDMDSFLDELGRHLRGQGLIGKQLAHLLDGFLPEVTIEDRTIDYRALKLMLSGTPTDSATLTREDFLTKLKSGGIIRWFCAQGTKRDKAAAAIRLYDSDTDSAIMVIAAKAGANEELDFNKSTLFGVHLLFAPANVTEPLHVKRLVFEERFRDTILKENPSCVKNTPAKP